MAVNLNDEGYLRHVMAYGGRMSSFQGEKGVPEAFEDPFSRFLSAGDRDEQGPIDFPLPQPFRMLATDPPNGLGDYMCHGHGGRYVVVSDRFKALLEEFGAKDVEWVPIEVEASKAPGEYGGGGELLKSGYWFLNSMRRLDLIDNDASDIIYDDLSFLQPEDREEVLAAMGPKEKWNVTYWRNLVLRDLPDDEHYFGVKRLGPSRFVSPTLARVIRERKMLVNINTIALNRTLRNTARSKTFVYFPGHGG